MKIETLREITFIAAVAGVSLLLAGMLLGQETTDTGGCLEAERAPAGKHDSMDFPGNVVRVEQLPLLGPGGKPANLASSSMRLFLLWTLASPEAPCMSSVV